jgi:membrane-bound serine protease (ClpP class)
VFFALEIHTGTGMLGAGGVISLVLGAVIAFRGSEVHFGSSSWLVVPFVGIVLAGLLGSLALGIASVRRKTAEIATSAIIGKVAVARTALTPEGMVFIQGERWRAHLERGTAREGDRVRIVSAEGFQLRVRKDDQG